MRILRADGELDPAPAPGFPRAAARAAAADGRLIRVESRESCSPAEADEWRHFAESSDIEVCSSLAIPLRNEQGDRLGALVLLASEHGGVAFPSERVDLGASLASQAALAVQEPLVDSFRSLFEGVIQLTVRAIDEKSSYTADHCRNVPILTELIADAACSPTRVR